MNRTWFLIKGLSLLNIGAVTLDICQVSIFLGIKPEKLFRFHEKMMSKILRDAAEYDM